MALVMACWLGLDAALKWAIVSGGEAALGARVEIGDLDTALFRGELHLRDMAAANPSQEMRNLVEADAATLIVDVAELTRGRLVVTSGQIRGIQFDTSRTTSGALPSVADMESESGPSMFDPLVAAAEERGAAWLDGVTGRLDADLQSKLQTPRVAQELQDRWPREYEALRTAVDDLQARGKQIEVGFREAKKNPLRNAAKFEQLAGDLSAMHQQATQLQARLAALPQQADADRRAVDAARKHDEQFLREQMQLDKLDGEQLSQYLLGEQVHGYLATSLSWIQRARALVPSKKPRTKSQSRGVNVAFVDRPRPDVLVRRLELLGKARLHGEELLLAGVMTDAASQPQWHDHPLRLQLVGSGAVPCELTVICDRRGQSACDTLDFSCPQLPVPGRTLGKADKLAVSMAPGAAMLTAHVELVDEQVTGQIAFVQPTAGVTASMRAVGDDRLDEALNKSLAALSRVEATVAVSGSVRRPDLELSSNLGPDLAAGFNGAFRAYLAEKADRVLAKAQAQVDQQIAKLDAQRKAAQQELLAQLGEHQQLLTQLKPLMGAQPPVGAKLPGGIVLPGAFEEAAAKMGTLPGKLTR